MSPAALLLSTLLLAAAGKPPSAEEQRLFDEGMKAMQAGDAPRPTRPGARATRSPRTRRFWSAWARPRRKPANRRKPARAIAATCARCPTPRIARRSSSASRAWARRARRRPRPPTRTRSRAPSVEGPPPSDARARRRPPPRAAVPRGARRRDRAAARRRRRGLGLERLQHHRLGRDRRDGAGCSAPRRTTPRRPAPRRTTSTSLLRYQDPVTGVPLEYHTVAARYENAVRDGQHDDRVAKGALIVAAGTALVATAFFIVDSVRTPERHAERDRPRPLPLDAGLRPGAAPGGRPHDGVLRAAVELLMRRALAVAAAWRSWRVAGSGRGGPGLLQAGPPGVRVFLRRPAPHLPQRLHLRRRQPLP